jgi:cobalamin biosynthesis protein CbiD
MAEVFHSITGKDGGQDKAAMKASITAKLGKVYMKLHAVHSGSGSYSSESEGVGAHVEDARAALRAFWKISTRRLVEDVVSSVDMVLLQRGSEVIEQRILEEAQSWTTPSSTSVSVSELLCEDSTVRTRRNVVRVRQTRCVRLSAPSVLICFLS